MLITVPPYVRLMRRWRQKAQKVKRDQLTVDSLIIWMLFFSCGKGKHCLFICGASCFRRDTEPRAVQTTDMADAALEKMSVFWGNKGLMRFLGITRICKKYEILFSISLKIFWTVVRSCLLFVCHLN